MKLWSGLLVSLIAAGALVAPAAAQNAAKPAIVYSTGGKFDKSFNEGVSAGAEQFNKETGIAIAEFEPSNETQFEQAHRRFAQRGQDPIVAVGFSQAVALEKVAKEFPNVHFTIIDSVVHAAQRAVRRFQGAGGLVPGRRAGRARLQERQGRLRRRHGHPADPPLPVRLRAGHQVRQPQGRADRQHDRHDAGRLERSGPRRRARQGPVRSRRRRGLCRGGLDRHRRAAGRQGSRQARDRRRFQPEPSASRHDADLDDQARRPRGLQQLQGGQGQAPGRAGSRCSA